MEIITLENTDLQSIVSIINESFADYIIPLQLTAEQLEQKIAAENIQLNLSIGVVSAGKLVGFMLHAINHLEGNVVVYNAATGVVPEFRGKGIVANMYGVLLAKLRELDVKTMLLEVIVGNDSAIRAYEKMGYRVNRTLDSFKGVIAIAAENKNHEVRDLVNLDWDCLKAFWTTSPSWQASAQALDNSRERLSVLGAYEDGELVGYVAFYASIARIQQLAVAPNQRRKGVATKLIEVMKTAIGSSEIAINNVDHEAVDVIAFLQSMGLSYRLSQFEMIKNL
ncbi:GNAT family N-acetyltransferase [Flavobacterium sp. HSC-61S13]|uniref:GNAT family N-acetyltransferase n=1 Tax=Flavobacterium sp. HSC-61S13 TaxID=2910963 RepID=UPI00209CAF18|nr:GNAT family N-acetyltransferase [Flavobacterium sp. HSC-61S13]MCP1996428.1 ribosomal protein S18 acetylase RimI-like enzyme [Flavobacterium sp. HSC-61S13]